MPVIGLESEFRVFVDEREMAPENVWKTPAGFIERPLLKRTTKSSQLPTGGAVYFDGGVLEVVTPVIEVAPRCTARVVRSLWEQIRFVRAELDGWEARSGRRVRLEAFSCHVNISFELPRQERGRDCTIQKLALLLSLVLPAPVIVAGANRRSTAIGVRPRRERIEITLDFTPEPGLMGAAVALIVGVVRAIIAWPSYRVGAAEEHGVPIIAAITPGQHGSRKGWAVRAEHFAHDPFTGDVDAPLWRTTSGRTLSLRRVALATATLFRDSIGSVADSVSERLLFSILRGESPSLLDLPGRPFAYDDVGRAACWAPWTQSKRLARSVYERVFLDLTSGRTFNVGTPVKVKGWYHVIFRAPGGEERMLSIDQLARLAQQAETGPASSGSASEYEARR